MTENGRPRYWMGWYDRWNLVLPLALIGVLVWLAMQPGARPVERAVGGGGGLAKPVLPPLMAPTLESPVSGAHVRSDRMGDVEGRGPAGALLVLFYSAAPSVGRRELARMTVGADGRYRFRLNPFPPGAYVLQVIAYAPDGRSAASAPTDVWVADAGGAGQRRRRAGP